MIHRTNRLSTAADLLVFAFPVLILCVPRGAGVFLAGVFLLVLASWRGMGRAWREHAGVLTPLACAILAFLAVRIVSKLYFDLPWNVIDNSSRALLAILTCWVIVRSAPNPIWLWRGISVGLVLALLTVGYQYFVLDVPRPSAWTQAIAFANMVATLALVGFARPGSSRASHAVAWFNVACAAGILMMNGTRGAMIALLVTLFPMLLLRYRRIRVRMLGAAVAAIVALVVGVYMIPGSPLAARVDLALSQFHDFEKGNAESSVGARLEIWQFGMRYFASHPWMGAGEGQFARILHSSSYCEQRRTRSVTCVLEHAHNDIVEAASTTGIPGLLTLLGIFLVPAVLFRRAMVTCSRHDKNDQGISLAGAGLAVAMASLICGLTQVTTAHQANVVFYAGIAGLLLGLAERKAREASSISRSRQAGVSSESKSTTVESSSVDVAAG